MDKQKINYSEENLYAAYSELLSQRRKNLIKITSDPEIQETTWYYDFIPYQSDEEVRVCAVLPLMKMELEEGFVSTDMLDEIVGYYEAIILEGSFDDILKDDEEREIVKKDLKWCYDTALNEGLIQK